VPLIAPVRAPKACASQQIRVHLRPAYSGEFAKNGDNLKTTGVDRVAVIYSDDLPGRRASSWPSSAGQSRHQAVASIGFKPANRKARSTGAQSRPAGDRDDHGGGPGAEFYAGSSSSERPQVFTWSITVVEASISSREKAYGLVMSIVPRRWTRPSAYRATTRRAEKNPASDGATPAWRATFRRASWSKALRRAGGAAREKLIAALDGMRDYDSAATWSASTAPTMSAGALSTSIVGRDGGFCIDPLGTARPESRTAGRSTA